MRFSIIILYYNREELLKKLVAHLLAQHLMDVEIIIVDNASDVNLSNEYSNLSERIKYARLSNNLGAVARNVGFNISRGEYIICLDDDIDGITGDDLIEIVNKFRDSSIAAVCFKVINPVNGAVMNWSHHYDQSVYCNVEFETNEISEGAVVFRKSVLDAVGLYFEKYFISHEGPDLACRILDRGYKIIFMPTIVVRHHHSDVGRKSWRRYYYDTRNLVWLNVRHYPAFMAIRRILWGLFAMLIYSIRDGYIIYWIKGVKDALVNFKEIVENRNVISEKTVKYIKYIESNRPCFIKLIKQRLFRSNVRI